MQGSVLAHAELYIHMMVIEGGQDANDLGVGGGRALCPLPHRPIPPA